MNTQKLTQKSLEAIQSANGLAIENQNQQIEQVHLLSALLGTVHCGRQKKRLPT